MGNWGSKSEKKNTENVSENLVKKNNNSPKKPKYGFFKKAPEFWMAFNHGLKRNKKTGNTGDGNLMTKYKINNEDLDENNLADVFINKIMKDTNNTDKSIALNELLDRLSRIKNREVDKEVLPEIKKAIFIIKDNYTKYEDKIKKRIESVKPAANANAAAKPANLAANAAANAAANTGVAKPTANAAANPAANANPTSGGSRKKYKKSRS